MKNCPTCRQHITVINPWDVATAINKLTALIENRESGDGKLCYDLDGGRTNAHTLADKAFWASPFLSAKELGITHVAAYTLTYKDAVTKLREGWLPPGWELKPIKHSYRLINIANVVHGDKVLFDNEDNIVMVTSIKVGEYWTIINNDDKFEIDNDSIVAILT